VDAITNLPSPGIFTLRNADHDFGLVGDAGINGTRTHRRPSLRTAPSSWSGPISRTARASSRPGARARPVPTEKSIRIERCT